MLKMERHIDIDRFDYDLPDERIAKYPLEAIGIEAACLRTGGNLGAPLPRHRRHTA